MSDFKIQIQSFTCIGSETKKKILDACADLEPEKQEGVLEVLKKGEEKKKALVDDHNKTVLGILEEYLDAVKEFKRGPLRKAFKDVESVDHTRDEESAEDLLKDL